MFFISHTDKLLIREYKTRTMKCGNCGTEFSDEEVTCVPPADCSAINSHEYNEHRKQYIAHKCPGCGAILSTEFTRERNAQSCACSATGDDGHGGEVCYDCGYIRGGLNDGGFSDHHAVPMSDHIESIRDYYETIE